MGELGRLFEEGFGGLFGKKEWWKVEDVVMVEACDVRACMWVVRMKGNVGWVCLLGKFKGGGKGLEFVHPRG